MKKGRLFCALFAAVFAFAFAPGALAIEDGSYIRLHVIASSDEARDQEIKLIVRDALRLEAGLSLAGCTTSQEAYDALSARAARLQKCAEQAARGAGFEGDVQLELGRYAFPDRTYAGKLLPEGDYYALRVVLGAGRGHNWWCVLYPEMCLPEDADGAEAEPVQFYFGIWRALRRWFGGECA